MKILVIDDNEVNLSAAKAQLVDHELVVASSYDEAQKLVVSWARTGSIDDRSHGRHDFDVVLVDLLMPASAQVQNLEGRQYVGQEMPIGIFLALLAARNGARYVAVHTDSDHHSHPASACFDDFNTRETKPTPFQVENAKVLLSNNRRWVQLFLREDLTKPLEQDIYGRVAVEVTRTVRAKNWRALLDYLLA